MLQVQLFPLILLQTPVIRPYQASPVRRNHPEQLFDSVPSGEPANNPGPVLVFSLVSPHLHLEESQRVGIDGDPQRFSRPNVSSQPLVDFFDQLALNKFVGSSTFERPMPLK